jgi:uncharacterized protein involved in propanediol utilization
MPESYYIQRSIINKFTVYKITERQIRKLMLKINPREQIIFHHLRVQSSNLKNGSRSQTIVVLHLHSLRVDQ